MKEEEIRPQRIFDEYLRLAEADADKYFRDAALFDIKCPACGTAGEYVFTKAGFSYEECTSCQTLFVNPRPAAETFARYYTEAESVRFWATTFYRETADARREKLWKPKARMVQELVAKHGRVDSSVIDVGGGYGIFAEEYQRLSGRTVVVIEPGPDLAAVCRSKGLTVVESFLEDLTEQQLPGGPKVYVSFELIEHLPDLGGFIRRLHSLMARNDLFIFTTLSGIGLDIRVLWAASKSVSPPHHLNFLNPRSARLMLESMDFEVLHSSTPGQLDVDILCRNREQIQDRFWRTFASYADDEQKRRTQEFVAQNGFSSHMLIVCRKT